MEVGFLLPFDSTRIPISQELLGVNCLTSGKSGVTQGVGYQILLPFPVSLVSLLYCTTL